MADLFDQLYPDPAPTVAPSPGGDMFDQLYPDTPAKAVSPLTTFNQNVVQPQIQANTELADQLGQLAIQRRLQGVKPVRIDHPDGTVTFEDQPVAPPTTLRPEEKIAMLQASRQHYGGTPLPMQDPAQMEAQVRQASAQGQSEFVNTVNAIAKPLTDLPVNIGRVVTDPLLTDEQSNATQLGLQEQFGGFYATDPNRTSTEVGNVIGNTAKFAPAVLMGPGAGALLAGGERFGGAQGELAARGEDTGSVAGLADAGIKALAAAGLTRFQIQRFAASGQAALLREGVGNAIKAYAGNAGVAIAGNQLQAATDYATDALLTGSADLDQLREQLNLKNTAIAGGIGAVMTPLGAAAHGDTAAPVRERAAAPVEAKPAPVAEAPKPAVEPLDVAPRVKTPSPVPVIERPGRAKLTAKGQDLGQLREFAREQGYTIDEARLAEDVAAGERPRNAARQQIEEQYAPETMTDQGPKELPPVPQEDKTGPIPLEPDAIALRKGTEPIPSSKPVPDVKATKKTVKLVPEEALPDVAALPEKAPFAKSMEEGADKTRAVAEELKQEVKRTGEIADRAKEAATRYEGQKEYLPDDDSTKAAMAVVKQQRPDTTFHEPTGEHKQLADALAPLGKKVVVVKGAKGSFAARGHPDVLFISDRASGDTLNEHVVHELFHTVQDQHPDLASETQALWGKEEHAAAVDEYTDRARNAGMFNVVEAMKTSAAIRNRESGALLVGDAARNPSVIRGLTGDQRSWLRKTVDSILEFIRVKPKLTEIEQKVKSQLEKIRNRLEGDTKAKTPEALEEKFGKLEVPENIAALPEKDEKPTLAGVRASLPKLKVSAHAPVAQKAQAVAQAMNQLPPPPITPPSVSNSPTPAPSRGWGTAKKGIQNLITRIDYQIRDVSPELFGRVSEYQFRSGTESERLIRPMRDQTHALSEDIRGRSEPAQAEFDKAYLDNDIAKMKQLAPGHDDLIDTWRTTMDALSAAEKAAGLEVGRRQDYLPRTIADVEGYKQALGKDWGQYEAAIEAAAKQQGRPASSFTPSELGEIINNEINGFGPVVPGKKGISFSKERTVQAVPPEHVKFYDTFEHSIPQYIAKATQAGERAKMLGKSKTAADIDQSVGGIIRKEIEAGRMHKDDQDTAHALLTTRLVGEMNHMGSTTNAIRTIGYLSSLGQFRNAIGNLADIGSTVISYGAKDTLKGIRQATGMLPGGRQHEDIGIHSYGEEFRDRGALNDTLEKVMKATGFAKLDRFGKEVRQNASRSFMETAAKNPASRQARGLKIQYERVLGKERFAQAMTDLAAGKTTEDVGYLEWLETTKMQPVGLNQMPPQYLKMKNGRILYQMKTFTLTQLEGMRREVLGKLTTPGQRAEGALALGRLLTIGTLTGMSKDLISDLLKGKDVSADQIPERAVNGLLTWVGLSTFDLKKAWADPIEWATDWWVSPAQIFKSTVHDIKTVGGTLPGKNQPAGSKLIRHVPMIGDLLYYWSPLGEGYHKNHQDADTTFKKKMNELRSVAKEAYATKDYATANQAIAGFNEAQRRAPVNVTVRKTPLTIEDLESRRQAKAKKDSDEAGK